MDITTAICTHNRAGSLRRTVEATGRTRLPENPGCEVLVVDNASTDRAAEVVNSEGFADAGLEMERTLTELAGASALTTIEASSRTTIEASSRTTI